jgi:hypothetical protein
MRSFVCSTGYHEGCKSGKSGCDCECHPPPPPPKYERYQTLIRSAGGPAKISCYVVEIDEGEWIKQKCLGGSLKPWGIRSKLIKRFWTIARYVYDGRTGKSAGQQARLVAELCLLRLQRGEKLDYKLTERRKG